MLILMVSVDTSSGGATQMLNELLIDCAAEVAIWEINLMVWPSANVIGCMSLTIPVNHCSWQYLYAESQHIRPNYRICS